LIDHRVSATDLAPEHQEIPMWAHFTNNSQTVSSFAVEWNGGQTNRTGQISETESASLDLSAYAAILPLGTSCWARAYPVLAPNHDSRDNFNVQTSGTASYEMVGGPGDLEFRYHGISSEESSDAESAAPAAAGS
jgi:hypothetical protein